MTDTLRYVFVELGRFLKHESECVTFMDMLTYSIKMMHQFDKMPASFEDDVIKYLYKLSEMYNFTAKELEAYKKSLDMNWDIKNIEDFAHEKGYNAGHAEGEAKGKAEGKVEGRSEAQAEMVRI
ncbi:MAG: PD-(D/E)XK nuclease family transposase [Bacteroidales bacterium]|nr:PD-(D/E)XK nuclease family transposase [Bacteroidales bacterium]